MNEQLQNALVQLINKSMNGLDTSVQFLNNQLPDVVKQLIGWKIVSSLFLILVCIVVLVLSFKLFKLKNKMMKEGFEKKKANFFHDGTNYSPETPSGAMCIMVVCVLDIISLIGLFCNFLDLIQLTLAPKIYLIEYVSSLVK